MSKKVWLFSFLFFLFAAATIFGFFHKNGGKEIGFEIKKQNIREDKKETAASSSAVSFIVPHHLLAENLIENTFQKMSEINRASDIERIILISPNHFNLGRGWAISSNSFWNTKEGKIEADEKIIRILQNEKILNIENNAFEREHGIKNILPFIKKYFPEARIIPIIIKDGFPQSLAENLAESLKKNVSEKTLLVLSSDFSHELEENISDFHDRRAIEAIESMDYSNIYGLDTDCAPGLYVAMKYSELGGHSNFQLLENSSSSKINKKNYVGENTSYITGYFAKEKENKEENKKNSVYLLFAGDLMLDRHNKTLADKNGSGWFVEKIKRLFWSQDANIANLEGPITSKDSVSVFAKETEKNHFIFTFSPEKTESFFNAGKISIANIGNNHILNFGQDGLEQTKKNLKNFKVNYFGDPFDENNFLIEEINGIKFAFINYNQFSSISFEKTAEKIRQVEKNSDFLIVYTHWGIEYQLSENENQRKIAHSFIDSGADLIIGSHPHVVQPVEIYKGKAIFYSLGNFIFDQYFSEDVRNRLAVAASINEERVDFYLVPLFVSGNGQIILANNQKREELLNRISNNSKAGEKEKDGIRKGKFTILNE